jgi:predicted secreted protein
MNGEFQQQINRLGLDVLAKRTFASRPCAAQPGELGTREHDTHLLRLAELFGRVDPPDQAAEDAGTDRMVHRRTRFSQG